MEADRNLLSAVLALQADVIDADKFIQICTLWTTRKQTALADLLLDLAWITPIDKADVERLLERKLKKHDGDARAGLAVISDSLSNARAQPCRTSTSIVPSASCQGQRRKRH